MSKPITPRQAKEAKKTSIPEYVFDAFNKFIGENLDNTGRASFKQKKIVEYIIETASLNGDSLSSEIIFKNKWLDVEAIYAEVGWEVRYESPCIGETFDAYFKFVDNSRNTYVSGGYR
jgi:hypothetical protein